MASFPRTLHTQVSQTESTEQLISLETWSTAASLWKPWCLNHPLCERDWRMGAHPQCLKLREGAGFLDLSSSIVWTKCSGNRVSLLGATYTQTMPFREKMHCSILLLSFRKAFPLSSQQSNQLFNDLRSRQGLFAPPPQKVSWGEEQFNTVHKTCAFESSVRTIKLKIIKATSPGPKGVSWSQYWLPTTQWGTSHPSPFHFPAPCVFSFALGR